MCLCLPHMPHFDRNQRQKVFKWMSFFFLVIFLVHGFVNVAVSIWLELFNVPQCGFLSTYLAPVHILLAAGCFIVVLVVATFLYNFFYKSAVYFRSFTCILVIVVVFELAAAVIAAVMKHKLDNNDFYRDMERHLTRTEGDGVASVSHTSGVREAHRKCWTDLQQKYQCCGLTGYMDFLHSNNSDSNSSSAAWQGNSYTDACKCSGADNCQDTGGPYSVFRDGCHDVIKEEISFICLFTQIFGPVFGSFQAISYVIMYYIFTKMNRSTIIAVYKAKESEASLGETNSGHI